MTSSAWTILLTWQHLQIFEEVGPAPQEGPLGLKRGRQKQGKTLVQVLSRVSLGQFFPGEDEEAEGETGVVSALHTSEVGLASQSFLPLITDTLLPSAAGSGNLAKGLREVLWREVVWTGRTEPVASPGFLTHTPEATIHVVHIPHICH